MGDLCKLPSLASVDVSSLTATSSLTNISTHASANTKGNYIELLASSAFKADMMVICGSYAYPTQDYLIDIAIGAASSEIIIIPNLIMSSVADEGCSASHVSIPVSIPAGTRISARSQGSSGGQYARLMVQLISCDFFKPDGAAFFSTYGAVTSDSGGTQIDPGGSANTKGSWVEITASTTYRSVGLFIGFGNKANSARTLTSFLFDIAVGAGGSEVVLIPNIPNAVSTGSKFGHTWSAFYPVVIPAGTRLAVRAQCGITDATDRLADVVLYLLNG